MGRAGRVNVKRKEVEIARAINPALLRRHTGVLRKSKNQDETFLTEPTSLEMLSTLIGGDPSTTGITSVPINRDRLLMRGALGHHVHPD